MTPLALIDRQEQVPDGGESCLFCTNLTTSSDLCLHELHLRLHELQRLIIKKA